MLLVCLKPRRRRRCTLRITTTSAPPTPRLARSTSRLRSLRRGRVRPGKACTMDRARGAITTAVFLTPLIAVLSRRGVTDLSWLLARAVNEEAARTAASFFVLATTFISLPGCVPRTRRSAISAFTRVFDLWRCAADPGSIALECCLLCSHRSRLSAAALHRVRDTRLVIGGVA